MSRVDVANSLPYLFSQTLIHRGVLINSIVIAIVWKWHSQIAIVRKAYFLPNEGAPYDALVRDIDVLFDSYASEGSIRISYQTEVHTARRADATT